LSAIIKWETRRELTCSEGVLSAFYRRQKP